MIARIQQFLTFILLLLPAWGLIRCLWLLLRSSRRRPRWLRELAVGSFAAFMAAVLYMTLKGQWSAPLEMLQAAAARLETGNRIRLRLFQTIGPQLKRLPSTDSITQLLGNTLLFIPWGFCLPLLWRRFRTPLRMIGMSLALTCFIEFTQLFIGRYVELDDILLNALGSLLGAGGWWCLYRWFPQLDKLLE
ncbi:MAG: VanZ family protein [Clostridia bacterium]|nr:VanZ family protein [Clostridia bacterium]